MICKFFVSFEKALNPDESVVPGRDFIAPCKCKGSQKYVHRECLDNWRSIKVPFFILNCLVFFLSPNSRDYLYSILSNARTGHVRFNC